MPSHCQQCGKPVPNNGSDEGLCYACLMKMAAGTVGDETLPSTLINGPTGLPLVEGHTILEELARGGMGIVFKARQHEPEREVALKMLLPFDEHREDIRERFRVEISALAGLDHPRILPLYQSGTTGGRPWFTMKLATGGTLAARIKARRKPFSSTEAASLMAAMADAVQHAHSHGFLHRDIKPANILYDESGDAYLADFGLAKILDSTANLTRTSAALGTPCYMAPEVAAGGAKPATTAADIYGLGAVLYELLSGRPPFIVEGYHALLKKIAEETPPRPSTLAANVPRDLELVCMTCLEKDPRLRYTSAKDLAEDLRRYLRGEPVAARRAGPTARLIAWARRRPALATVSAALLLTIIGSSIWLTISGIQLRRALTAERDSRDRADATSEFFIGTLADKLEKMGRLSLIEETCAEAEKRDHPIDDAGYKRRARLLLRWASALWAKGDGTAAAPKLREALASMDALVARSPKDAQAFTLALQAHCRLAEVLADTTSFTEALTQLDTADAALARPGILPLDDALRWQAETDRTRAQIWNRHRRDDSETTLANATRAVASYRAWQARDPAKRDRTLALAAALREAGKSWYNASGEHPDQPNLEKALPLFTEGADLIRALPNRTPDEEFELAYAAGWMGDCLLRLDGKGPAAARPLHEEESKIITALADRDPLNGEWQHKLANSHLSLAETSRAAGDKPTAETEWKQCRDILKKLHEETPFVRSWAMSYLNALLRDGSRALKEKTPPSPETTAMLEECAALAAARVQSVAHSSYEREGWRDLTDRVASTLAAATPGDPGRAQAILHRAATIAETFAKDPGPGQPWWEATLIHYQRLTVSSAESAANQKAWLAANLPGMEQRATAAGRRLAATPDSIPECENWKSLTDEIGKALEDQKDWPHALTLYRTARDLARQTATLPGPGQLWWEWTLAHYHRRVAYASKQTGALPDWLAENLPALEIRVRHLKTGSPFARKDPKAVANAFLVTIESQLANQQPAAALATATRCLDLYLECQATAGPTHEWAAPLIKACETCTNDKTLAAQAHTLAARAALKLYPPESRAALSDKDRAAAEALDQLATHPAP